MRKKQGPSQTNQSNKSHKTLRDKLRKRREQLKKHKKQKSEKHKQFNVEEQKQKFFEQKNAKKKKRQDGIKQNKLNKYIEKFVDLYEDDVQDFYSLFGTLDQGGSIDISNTANPKMKKCLKKLFKYLPLNKKKLQYTKKQEAITKLKPLMTQLVSKSIQNYLQYGTDQEKRWQSQKQSSDEMENQQQEKKKKKKSTNESKKQQLLSKYDQKKLKSEKQHQVLRQYQQMELYPDKITSNIKDNDSKDIGPSISLEQREHLAKMFQEQLKNGNNEFYQKQQNNQEQNNQFERIFSMSTQKQSKNAKNKPKANIDDIPQQLLAQGSARIGQKQQIDLQQIQQYNKIHRPKKLIEQYQQMRKIGKYADPQQSKKRRPFDREKDIVNGRSRQFMNNGVFFDFKERMTKPKGTNNFL